MPPIYHLFYWLHNNCFHSESDEKQTTSFHILVSEVFSPSGVEKCPEPCYNRVYKDVLGGKYMNKGNVKALLPIGIFLVLYLGLGITFEYILKIPMGFYNIPIVVSFLTALLVACIQNPSLKFDDKLEIMAKGVGEKNIMTMILIFLTAGIFVGVVGRSSAESVAYFLLSIIPPRFAVLVLFVVSCFVSLAMGTGGNDYTDYADCCGCLQWFRF